jgi:adenylate cyclase
MQQYSARRKLFRGMLVGLAGILVTVVLAITGALETWEAKSWDRQVRWLAKPGSATDQIRLIKLDQASLDWAETELGVAWPWFRQMFGYIVDYCRRSEARALAFDVIFTEFSPYGVTDDESLGQTIAEFGRFAGAITLLKAAGNDVEWPDYWSAVPRFKVDGLEQWLVRPEAQNIRFYNATFPIPEVAQHAAVLCNVQQDPDPDGIFRQITILGVLEDQIFPLLGLGTYLAAHPDEALRFESKRFLVGTHRIPIDNSGKAVLRYRGPSGTYRAYSAAEVLQAQFRIVNGEAPTPRDLEIAADLRGKYVLFGYTAHGLFDLRPAPVGGDYWGVEINATMLDNLLSGDFLQKVPAWFTWLCVGIVVWSVALLTSVYSTPLQNIMLGSVFLVIPFFLAIGGYIIGFWVPFATLETGSIATVAIGFVFNYATEGRQKRFIKDAFKHYLSPDVIEVLIQQPEKLKLGGERRTISIFFSDLQGFTSISEALEPEELTAVLNEYLSAMSDIIQEERGTIDKYEGDAIIAFWNAPLDVSDHAVRVVRAALKCQAALAAMRPAFQARIGKAMHMRIGMNTGAAVVGNMGSRNRFDYTMFGDAVNLASRLEGANKQFGTYTMISQYTAELLDDAFALRELGRLAVVGRQEPVTVYEPMFPENYEAHKTVLETFTEGLSVFYQGNFTHAREVFRSISGHDPAAAAYAEKCQGYIATPPQYWDGVWALTTK